MMKLSNKLGIGTVQFGLEYGINNRMGIPSDEEINHILAYYRQSCREPLIDTAVAYGNSHERLGIAFQKDNNYKNCIVSKFSPRVRTAQELRDECQTSLQILKVEALYGFLAHSAETLITNPSLLEALLELKKEGYVEKIGVSVYFPAQVDYFIDKDLPIDIIQAPFNVFDQRFAKTIELAKSKGIEVHTRSAFMQGLIFKPQPFFEGYFAPFLQGKKCLEDLAKTYDIPVQGLALAFCLKQPFIDRVIIGVDSKHNLEENIEAIAFFESSGLNETILKRFQELESIPEEILLPYNWPK
ncbi:aldo/keto reductase [Dyadobacter tibetensis]|uniref:aldo/keto reductase n=1 Tax=Dyadobacter tibetensis TaxID=1211851 RepID=UPI00046EB08F|nr:aldo/keto reductase [Dyadobacter tibetensis]